mmetsp:Transcript_51844/g.130222  ORF Transcript_51844/g.130222 Transcript_51844/m.130222 type:complete len:224 (+) Transcript_51844:1286-1957(+)
MNQTSVRPHTAPAPTALLCSRVTDGPSKCPCCVRVSLSVGSLVVLLVAPTGALGLLLASAHASGSAAAEWAGEREVDVLLALEVDHEGGHVDDLLAHPDVALADEHTGVVDGLGQAQLEHLGLQPTLHELGSRQTQHVIQLLLTLIEESHSHHPAQEGSSLEHADGVLLLECEEVPCRRPHLGEGVLDAPHLTLVLQAVLADDLHLAVQPLLLERPLGRVRHL